MKLTLLMTIFLISSCGKINLPEDSKLATLNSLTSLPIVAGSSEHSKIKEICDALQVKSVTISSLVNSDYVFSNTSKQCSDTSFSPIADANVKMINQSGSLKFSEGNNLFYFSDVETIDTGVLGLICQRIDNLVSPIALDSTNLLYFTALDFVSNDCQNEPNQRCLKIERAVKVSVSKTLEKGRVHTREWIKVRLDRPRIGFYSYRKLISEAGCIEGQYFGRTATLK
jgi:hypothetical protein